MALTDQSGNVTARFSYSPYGEVTRLTPANLGSPTAGLPTTPFLFNGQFGVMTEPNGLYCMQARFYSPIFRRFLNEDPAGFSGGINLYAYTGGDPVNLMDPFGLGPQLTGMQQGLVNALNFVSGLLSPFRMLMSNPADAHSDGNGLRNIANISTSTFNPARQVVNDDLSINYRGLGSTVSGLALGAFMENPGLLSSGRNLLTVDDFMVQAQTRLNAVKVEFGNIEAFNIVTPQPVSLSRLNAPLTRLFADPGKLARHGEFDWNKYTPILVEERNGILTIQDGMTRFENARQAGITELPAYVFPSR